MNSYCVMLIWGGLMMKESELDIARNVEVLETLKTH